ncbi:hypothetical protein ACJVC5_00770 [Peredibacter sp. HCB2-198]|uniref:hypothetical protein n=1 Tax=Peredibacter sp. HCB2-198 TaxID=3383025 RepID=UPI0038B45C8A
MKFFLMAMLVVFSGCAAYKNYNQSTKGKVVIRGGIYQKEAWEDLLVFQRMSWYHGVTLYYDALFYKADLNSPFSKWFSASEKEFFTKCESFLVTVGYSADPTKISHVNFREQMKLNGYDDVIINNFASYLRTHPSAAEWRFQNYKLMGFCKRSPSRLSTPNLAINFPSFRHLEIEL